MKYLITIGVFLLSLFSYGAPTSIKGKAPEFKGKKVYLHQYADHITKSLETLHETVVSDEGTFQFEVEVAATFLAVIKIEDINAHLFVQPESNYRFEFPKASKEQATTINRTTFVELVFEQLDTTDINYLITDFNLQYEGFFSEYYDEIARMKRPGNSSYKKEEETKRNLYHPEDGGENEKEKGKEQPAPGIKPKNERQTFDDLVNRLTNRLQKRYATIDNAYFHAYVQYAIASLKLSALPKKKTFYETYLREQPVRYRNTEYMAFFNEFYANHLLMASFSQKGAAITRIINKLQSPTLLNAFLSNDPFLEGEQLRELVMIRGLGELFYNKEYAEESVLVVLDSIRTQSQFPDNSVVANNVYAHLTKLREGSPAPDFSLYNQYNELVTLDDFKGKYVYLDFWATWCKPCLTEMTVMTDLYKKYGEDIEFVSISIDPHQKSMVGFLNQHPEYEWTFLHFGNHKDIRSDYNIRSVPSYFLIDPEGNLLQSPALPPSSPIERPGQTVEKAFYDIHLALHPRKKLKVWDD